jgi:raffinose/stachyose/melibiose transport system substrate-binding protein
MYRHRPLLLLVASLALAGAGFAQRASLTIESWRNDDLGIWQNTIIPAFNAHYPDIQVVFSPTAPAEYNAILNSRLAASSSAVTSRP